MDQEKIENTAAENQETPAKSEAELIESLQRRIEAMEHREAVRRVRTIRARCIIAALLIILVLIATPRVTAAAKTLESVSSTVQKYSTQLKELDPDKLQETIQMINNLDTDAIEEAGEKLDKIDLDTILTQIGRLETVAGEQTELKNAINIIGTMIEKIIASYNG
jgi:predicted PurR-regulated permease PerM